MNKKETTPRLKRWQMLLQQYHVKIIYIKGSENILTDRLSRVEIEEVQMIELEGEIIAKCHEEIDHGGVEATYKRMRERGYLGIKLAK